MNVYPFKMEDIDITIFIVDPEKKQVVDPNIVVGSISKNVSFYISEKESNNYKQIDKETFQEASDLVRKM